MNILKSDVSQMKEYIKTIMDNKEWLKDSQVDQEGKKTKRKQRKKGKANKKENTKMKKDKKCTTKIHNSLPKYNRIEIKGRFCTGTSRWLTVKLTVRSRNPYTGRRRDRNARLWHHI